MRSHELLQHVTTRNPESSEAFELLYQRFSGEVRRYLQRFVHDRRDVEDLVQEVFVQIWRHSSTYRDSLGSLKTWILRIAHNRAIDHLRSRRYKQTRREVEVDEEFEMFNHSTVNGWDEPVDWDRTNYVHHALTLLPTEHRNLIEMAFYQGFTHREISSLKGLPLGTVKTRIRNAMQSLRNHLGFLAEDAQVA